MPRVQLTSLHDTQLFAQGLALGLRGGDVIAFSGPIGSGKTTLIRSLTTALTGDDVASSPSFLLWQRYEGRIPVNHLDLYRIENQADLPELGLHEAFDSSSVTLVEWPEQAPTLLPAHTVYLKLQGAGDEPRHLELGYSLHEHSDHPGA